MGRRSLGGDHVMQIKPIRGASNHFENNKETEKKVIGMLQFQGVKVV